MRPPEETPAVPRDAHDTVRPPGAWDGPTYYGRPQLKAAPFENWAVGGYIFLAGLSGASALIAAVAERRLGDEAAGVARRGRYLSLLAPVLGAPLLIWDLHTPKRFYNMLRIARPTSPMSVGTWILTGFTGLSFVAAAAQFVADWAPRLRRPARAVGRAAQVPAAVAGAGLSTYTAALLAATSTPLWAAAPAALAVRFGSSSVAAGAGALSLGERSAPVRRALDAVSVAALVAELAAGAASHEAYRRRGVAAALEGGWGQVERQGVTALGTAGPLLLHMASLTLSRRPGRLSSLASWAGLAGSLLLRVSIMSAGDESASRPEISFRFSQPENLPVARLPGRARRGKRARRLPRRQVS